MPLTETQTKRVSYIISTRNRADFLEQTLLNVREFITPADELLVIDGASTDQTANVAERHRDLITKFVSEPDRGEAHGFNKGLLLARGRFIKFLTDDDYIFPEAMRTLVAVMEAQPELEAVMGGGEEWVVEAHTGQARLTRYLHLPETLTLADVRGIYLHTPCGVGLMVSRSLLARAGLFDTRFMVVDTEYMTRLAALGCRFHYLNVKLFRHRTFPHSGSVAKQHQAETDRLRILLAGGHWTLVQYADPKLLAQAMGLADLPGGQNLLHWIWLGERIRRVGALRPLLAVVGGLVVGLRWVGKQRHHLWQRLRSRQPTREVLVEPHWDGKLR